MEGILVTTAAETQKTHVDNRLKGRPQHESDCTGKAGFRNRIPEGNHHTTLVGLFISLATAFITVRMQSGWRLRLGWLCAQPFPNCGQRRVPVGREVSVSLR